MLNKVWFGLLFVGLAYGFAKGAYRAVVSPDTPPAVTGAAPDAPAVSSNPLREAGQTLTEAALHAAETAVTICITLIGMMALWLGMLNVARDAGMVDALARALRPATRWLFPEVPAGHPAEGAMLMNISANVLGMGNAATPFGLKAMRELQKLNAAKDAATNAMVTFLAINTSSVTIVPFTIIGLRVAAGSGNAARPLAGIILTTAASTAVAIVVSRVLSKRPRYALRQTPGDAAPNQDQQPGDKGGV